MISKMKLLRGSEQGFTLMELMFVLVIFLIVVAVVIMQVTGVFSSGQAAAMETDIHTVQQAVDQFILASNQPPTADLRFPGEGQYKAIDFSASVTVGVKTYTFVPDFVKKLPRHHDEGVWRIDDASIVSINLDPEDY